DDVHLDGNVPKRGTTVSTTSAAYSIVSIRTALRSLSSQLRLYSNNAPDTAVTGTPFDAIAVHPKAGTSFTERMQTILRPQDALLFDPLTDTNGRAWAGFDLARKAPIDDQDTLDAHTAAIRGLFAAFLATGEVRYRERAMAVFGRIQTVFYDRDARI